MAFQRVQDTAEIVIAYTGSGTNMVNVLAAHKTGGYDLAALESLADAVDAAVVAEWLPLQTLDVDYVSTTVRGLDQENDLEAVNVDGAGPGDQVGTGLPGSVSFALKKVSGFTGRSARGRMYWIGMLRADVSTNLNLLDSQPVIDITAAVDAMRAAIATEGWTPVIISRFSGGVKRIAADVFPWNSTVAVNSNVDSQRRRLLE